MIRRFAKNINNRKDLVNKISSITGLASHYTGMPRAAYEIGAFTVERDGTLAVTVKDAEGGNEGAVILALRADNMIGEELTPLHTSQSGQSETEQPEESHFNEAGTTEAETSETDSSTSYIPVEEMDDASYSVLGIEDWDPTEQEESDETDAHQAEELQSDDELQIDEPQLVETEETEETVTQDAGGSDSEDDEECAGDEADDNEKSGDANSDCGSLEVAFPLYKHTPTSIINLVCMLHSRGSLLSKATGGRFSASKELANALLDAGIFFKVKDVVKFIDEFVLSSQAVKTEPTTDETTRDAVSDEGEQAKGGMIGLRFEDDKMIFDGFTNVPDEAHARTFTHLASAMNKMALTQKRVQAKKVDETNEKYALRIWLVRLNLNGDEYKEDRKILMENLTGHTAFRTEAEKEKWTKRQLAKKMALKEATNETEDEEATADEPTE